MLFKDFFFYLIKRSKECLSACCVNGIKGRFAFLALHVPSFMNVNELKQANYTSNS